MHFTCENEETRRDLPEGESLVLALYLDEELEPHEISEILGVSETGVLDLLRRAVQRCRHIEQRRP
ncbi:MAG: hypothetical protein HWE20_01115 [Gammaproteobacteria bacterium]|nr:hypothetical protein [Gammaproteobacteria bacterium]